MEEELRQIIRKVVMERLICDHGKTLIPDRIQSISEELSQSIITEVLKHAELR